MVGQAVPPALRRHSRLVPQPSDSFLSASGRACPAPTRRRWRFGPGVAYTAPHHCRGEACLAHLEAL